MYTLPVSQCPKCELRFGSSSERDLHLREDHRRRPQPQPERAVAPAEPLAEQTSEATHQGDRDLHLHPYVIRGVTAAAILGLVSVLSWQVALMLTLFLLAGVVGWALRESDHP
jgi:hypothetical protein